jgi:hypothetical protein
MMDGSTNTKHVAAATESSDESFLAQGIIPDQASPAAAAGGGYGKPGRVSPDLVGFLLALKREASTSDHLDDLTGIFPPEWIEKRKQEHKERVALYKEIDDDMELYKDKIRRELSERGFIQAKKVDDEWVARHAKLEAWGKEQFAKSEKIEYDESEWED